MRNFFKTFSLILLVMLSAFALTSCKKSKVDKNDNKLRIVVKSAGFGDAWIFELEKIFEAENPDYDVEITSLYDANTLIQNHLESKDNADDLYISVGSEWKSYAAQGYFAELDEYLDDAVDDTTLEGKVADEYKNSIYFTKSDGSKHCYRLPWTSGVGGIYYNKKMFTENGWQIPTTFEQLLALCETIVNSNIPVKGSNKHAVKPFAYTGANTDYFDYTVLDWWAQIVGKDAINAFLRYDSAANFNTSSNPTYNALKTATSYWAKLFVNESGTGESKYVVANSKAKTAENAQKEFVNGYAAMMFNGDWLYNEIKNYGISTDNFELGLMKTPTIKEVNPAYANTSYVIGEDQFIVIPKTSAKVKVAMKFVKLMVSNQGSTIFTDKANGFLAYNTDFTNANITDAFTREVIELRSTYTTKFTSYSANRKYLCNFIDVWCTSALRPYAGLLNGTTPLDAAFSNIATTANSNWGDWTSRSE